MRVHPYQLLLGGVGSGAPWYFHQDAFNVVLHGAKRWFLRPPPFATLSMQHPWPSSVLLVQILPTAVPTITRAC
jgi:hypothetical protein